VASRSVALRGCPAGVEARQSHECSRVGDKAPCSVSSDADCTRALHASCASITSDSDGTRF
jgi:hypothetical protein